jgi:YHS domain-containing protein
MPPRATTLCYLLRFPEKTSSMKNTIKQILAALQLLLTSLPVFAQTDEKAPVYATSRGAIDGYDPVAYFTEQTPTKGSTAFSLEWKGATWYFATENNRTLFRQNPEKYAPQYGGWCAYGWSQGYPAKIDPTAWTIVDQKLYLNYNARIQKQWLKKQTEFIEAANRNYQRRF